MNIIANLGASSVWQRRKVNLTCNKPDYKELQLHCYVGLYLLTLLAISQLVMLQQVFLICTHRQNTSSDAQVDSNLPVRIKTFEENVSQGQFGLSGLTHEK